MNKNVAVWALLEEVLFQVWHEKFFVSLGNSWGSFVNLNDNTIQRKRLDIKRMLLSVENRLRIPSSVNVKIRGKSFKILISVEDSENVAGKYQACADESDSDEKDSSSNNSILGVINVAAYSKVNGELSNIE